MTILLHVRTGAEHQLGARYLIGRSAVCQLRLDSASISGVHAELVWNGHRWRVQDLGSRNGTFVDDDKLEPGEQRMLGPTSTLTFAVPEHRYRLVDAGGPRLSASSDGYELVLGEDGILCLPSVDACELSIFYSPGVMAWVVESERETRTLDEQGLVVVRGVPWRVTLPAPVVETREATSLAPHEAGLDELTLEFFVSRDEEHVSLTLARPQGAPPIALEERAHVMLLLTLARTRLADAAQGHLPTSEHGWMYRDQLETELGIDGQLLNLWVHRARRQFAQAAVCGAGGLIERRGQAQQLRLGAGRLVIHHA